VKINRETQNNLLRNDRIRAWINLYLLIFISFVSLNSCGYVGLLKPDEKKYPLKGIDISHHQNEIEWFKVKNKISFVFVKATEGSDFIDSRFHQNIDSIKKYNIPYAAYHFFTFCSSGKNQAVNFINNFKYDAGALPPVVDLEFLGKCNTTPPDDFDVIKEVKIFLETIDTHYNKTPIIYTTYAFYNEYLINDFNEYHFWIRDLFKEPKLKDKKNFVFWQYSNCGKIDGITGNVDMNVFVGNKSDFEKLTTHSVN
jgi:lysozyme